MTSSRAHTLIDTSIINTHSRGDRRHPRRDLRESEGRHHCRERAQRLGAEARATVSRGRLAPSYRRLLNAEGAEVYAPTRSPPVGGKGRDASVPSFIPRPFKRRVYFMLSRGNLLNTLWITCLYERVLKDLLLELSLRKWPASEIDFRCCKEDCVCISRWNRRTYVLQ